MWHRNQHKTNKIKAARFQMEMADKLWRRYTKAPGIYKDVKPFVSGYCVCLVPIDSYSNKEKGLREAIEACSERIIFSSKEKRFCEIKEARINLCKNTSRRYFDEKTAEKIDQKYFNNKIYKKGKLGLMPINTKTYNNLSEDAKKWFVQDTYFEDTWNGRELKYCWRIRKEVNPSWLRETEKTIYRKTLFVPDNETIKEAEYLRQKLEQSKMDEKVYHDFYSYKYDSRGYSSGEKKREYKDLQFQLEEAEC